jgi:ankyrin repeat protein
MGHSGLSQAAAYGNALTLTAMLRAGADVAQYSPGKGMGALFRACYNGHFAAERGAAECVSILIDSRASVDAQSKEGKSVLHVAACNGHDKIVAQLLAAGADAHFTYAGARIPELIKRRCPR